MTDVFISYSHADRDCAAQIATRLIAAGFSVWWDDRLSPRKPWDEAIEAELARAAAVLVLWSPEAVQSEWVKIEAKYAKERDKLLPVMIRACAPPLEYTFTQFLDLSDWGGEGDPPVWCKLLAWLADFRDQPDTRAGETGPKRENAFRHTLFRLPSGEPVYESAGIGPRTPAGTLFADAAQASVVMRVVPAGTFTMGADPSDPDRSIQEAPRKTVTIPRPLGIAIYPMATEAFQCFCPDGPCVVDRQAPQSFFARLLGGGPQKGPVAVPPRRQSAVLTELSFAEAQDLAKAVSEQTGARYRLPSEAEWEYACRAGTVTRYAFGDTVTPRDACFGGGAPPVSGSFAPNRFGLYDMHGAVSEWTQDTWHDTLDFTPVDGQPYVDTRSGMKVVRGGCWRDEASQLRSAARGRASQGLRSPEIGVRLVRELEQ